MAEFNPSISTNLGDNYTTRSQGRTPNKALGILFESLADGVKAYSAQKAKAADTAVENAVTSGIDNLDSESLIPNEVKTRHVGGAGSQAENFQSEELPDSLYSGAQSLQTMRQSYLQGKMSDIYYKTRVAALSKNLRAQFPQYDGKIDAMLERALNASSANSLRKELNEVFKQEAATASDEEKRKRALIQSHEEYLADPEVLSDYERYAGKKFNPEDLNEYAFMQATANRKYQDAARTRREAIRKDFAGAAADKELLGVEHATKDAQNLRDSLAYVGLGNILDNIKSDPNSTQSTEGVLLSNLMDKGGKLSPDEASALTQIFGRTRARVEMSADNLLAGYAGFITDKKKRDDIKSIITEPLKVIEDSLTHGSTGTLNAIQNNLKAKKDYQDNVYITQNGDFLNKIKLWKEKVGEKAVNDFFTGSDLANADASPVSKALHDQMAVDLGTGASLKDTLNYLDVTKSVTPENNSAIISAVEDTAKMITNPEMDKKKAAEIAMSAFFSPKNLTVLEDYATKNPEVFLNSLISPEMTEKMLGTAAWPAYAKFAYRQAGAAMTPVADTAMSAQAGTNSAEIKYDEKTQRFTFKDLGANDPILGTNIFSLWDDVQTGYGEDAVTTLNRYLDRIQPILDKEGQSVPTFLESFMLSNKYKNMEKEGGLMQRMSRSLNKWLTEQKAKEEGTSKANSKGFPGKGGRLQEDEIPDSPILRLISKAEGAGYNTLFGGGETDLSSMTVAEVLNMQGAYAKTKGSSATGSNQVMKATLKDLVKMGVVRTSEKFTPQLQDRIGHALLERRGYSKFINGELDIEDFADNLAKEWASFPLRSGESAYAKDGVNKATISRELLIKELERLRQ